MIFSVLSSANEGLRSKLFMDRHGTRLVGNLNVMADQRFEIGRTLCKFQAASVDIGTINPVGETRVDKLFAVPKDCVSRIGNSWRNDAYNRRLAPQHIDAAQENEAAL